MNEKDFELILKTGESFFVEFKERLDKSLAKEIVAFSNSQGGKIFIGITDNGKIKGIRITNKIVVFNPGGLVKWLKPEEFGTISKTRNPIIASLLSRTIFVEKMGTGINRIRKAMESSNLPAPEFKFYEHSFYVNLFDRTMIKGIGIESQETVEKTVEKTRVKTVVEKFGEKFGENELKVIALLKLNSKITVLELAGKVGITTRGIEKILQRLKEKSIIKRIGPARGGHWEVIEK